MAKTQLDPSLSKGPSAPGEGLSSRHIPIPITYDGELNRREKISFGDNHSMQSILYDYFEMIGDIPKIVFSFYTDSEPGAAVKLNIARLKYLGVEIAKINIREGESVSNIQIIICGWRNIYIALTDYIYPFNRNHHMIDSLKEVMTKVKSSLPDEKIHVWMDSWMGTRTKEEQVVLVTKQYSEKEKRILDIFGITEDDLGKKNLVDGHFKVLEALSMFAKSYTTGSLVEAILNIGPKRLSTCFVRLVCLLLPMFTIPRFAAWTLTALIEIDDSKITENFIQEIISLKRESDNEISFFETVKQKGKQKCEFAE